MGAAADKAWQGAPGSFPERLLASLPGWSGAAAPLQADAIAAAVLPTCAATAAGAPGWSSTGARTRFGHRVRIVPCTRRGDVRGVRGDRSRHLILLLLGP